MDANAVAVGIRTGNNNSSSISSNNNNTVSHVLESMSVLLLALAIADKEFVAREPVAVILQQQRLTQEQRLPAAMQLLQRIPGQGQGRLQGRLLRGHGPPRMPLDLPLDDAGVPHGVPLGLTLTRELHRTGRWPLLQLGCCGEDSSRRRQDEVSQHPRHPPPPPRPQPPPPLCDSYVIASRLDALPALLDEAVRRPCWNAAARFLILLMDKHSDEAESLGRARAAVAALWRLFASRLVVVDSMRVYSWTAYVAPTPCTDTSAPTLVVNVGGEASPAGALAALARPLYPTPRSDGRLAGCVLRYGGVAWPPFVLNPTRSKDQDRGFDRGVDVNMLRTFVRHKGMRPRFVPLLGEEKEQRWGAALANGSWSGLFGLLHRGAVDVVFGGCYSLPDRLATFRTTVPYITEFIVWWVPRPQRVPNWQLMFSVFNREKALWGYYVMVICLPVVLAMQRMQRWRRRLRGRPTGASGTSAAQVVLSLFAVVLELPPLFSPWATAPRLFYFMLFFFFFHFNIVFRTAMMADLAKHPLQPGLQTYWDLLRQGVEVGTVSADPTADLLLEDADLEPIRDLHKDCEASACLRKLQRRSPKYGLLFSNTVMHYLMPLYFLDSSGQPYVERLQTPALTQYVSMYLRKGDPLARQIDDVFLRLIQAGLPDLWLTRVSTANSRARRTAGEDKDGDGVPDEDAGSSGTQVLTLEHLVGAIIALFLGQTMAVAAFLAEVGAGLGAWVGRHLSVSVSWHPATASDTAASARVDGRRGAAKRVPGPGLLLLSRMPPATKHRLGKPLAGP